MVKILDILALILFVVVSICSVLYWVNETYYPISGVALLLFIITVAVKRVKVKK